MKHNSKLNRSRWLLLTLFTLLVGISPAWGETLTANFNTNNTYPSGWSYVGSISFDDTRRRGSTGFGLATSAKDASANYIITEEIEGTLTFYARAYNKNTNAYVFVYAYDGSAIGDQLYATSNMKTASTPSWSEYSANLGEYKGKVAIALNYAAIDDVTYTEGALTFPTLTVTNTTAASATLEWNQIGEETAWQVSYSADAEFDPSSNPINVTSKSYTLTGLTEGTIYYAYVRIDNGNGTYSDWSKKVSFKATNEKEVTINEANTYTSYVPFYGYGIDNGYGNGQIIIPASDLSTMSSRKITKMVFYSRNDNTSYRTTDFNGAEFEIYLQEVENETFASNTITWSDGMTKVYSGSLTVSDYLMTITLDAQYVYNGGNLLIGFKQTENASAYKFWYWIAKAYTPTTTKLGLYQNGNNTNSINYIPKITFTSLPATTVNVTGVTLNESELTLEAGQNETLTAIISPNDATDSSVSWESSDEDVATVDNGIVTGVGAGTATITVTTTDGGFTATCEVTVNAATPVSGVSLNKESTTIFVGSSETLEATVAPDNATNKNITWTSSDETVATVTDGTVNALKAGTATITVTTEDGSKTATCTVTVQNVAVTGMTLSESAVAMIAEETLTLVPTFEPSDATIKTVTWESSNTDVATVDENGIVTAVANGTANITATSSDNTSVKATCVVNVTTAETSTVNDGEATSADVINGYYGDYYQKAEFIIPASELGDIDGGSIRGMNLHVSTVANKAFTSTFVVFLKEVESTSINSYFGYSENDVLFSGVLDATTSTLSIPFSKGYSYKGGNLLVGIYNTTKSGAFTSNGTPKFYGKESTGSMISNYSNYSLSNVSATQRNFLPKTTFTYIPSDNPKMEVSDASIDFGLITTNSTTEDKQKTITISNAKGRATLSGISVSMKEGSDSQFTLSEGIATSVAAGEETSFIVTFTPGEKENYTGTIVISATDQTPVEVELAATYRNNPATIAVTLGEDAIGETVEFGSVNKQTVKEFSITNSGDLPLTVTSITSSNTTDFTVQSDITTVAGGETKTFTVTFVFGENPAYDAEKTATITIKNSAGDDVTFNVTGTRIELWEEDFSGSSLPDGWEDAAGAWTFAGNGEAVGTYHNGYYLYTPSLTVEEGKSMTFEAKKTGGYVDLIVYYSKDNGAYTQYTGLADLTTEYQTYTISGLAAGNYKFRINDEAVYLKNFQGFKLNANDPTLFVSSDAAGNNEITSGTAKDFGWANTAQSAVYYIQNTGTGTLTINSISNVDGFTATTANDAMTVAKDADPLALTITMNVASEGAKNGTFTITTDGGTFTIPVSGYVIGSKNLIDFTANEATIPTGWKRGNWTVTNGVAISTSSSTMETKSFTVEAGENLLVDIKGNSDNVTKTFAYSYSTDNGSSWSDANTLINESGYTIVNDQVLTISDIADAKEERTVLIRFTGQNLGIKHIYGFTAVNEPIMTTTAADIAFGMQTTESTEQTFTISNEGNATLEGLSVTLGKTGENAEYEVRMTDSEDNAFTATTLDAGATITVHVKQLYDIDNCGSKNDVLNIAANGQTPVAINLSGATRDVSKLYVDFESGMPDGWTKNSWYIDAKAARAPYTASSLITTPLTVTENETLSFNAYRTSSGTAPTFKIRYTTNGGITWSEYVDYSSQITSTTPITLELNNVPAGTVVVEFYGSYVYLDNIYGFVNTTAPMLSLTESAVAVANGSTKEFGNLTEAGTATYTLSNTGTADLVSTVATTGVATAAISGEGEGVTISENTVTLAPGKSATITLTLPYEVPYGEKAGAMTISSEGWVGDMVVNYTATTIDPTALYVDFNDNTKPAGWYQQTSGWTISTGRAHVYTGVAKALVTEQYAAEEGKNVLRFDAKKQNNYADGELKVYTSTDRKTWTLAKTVTLTNEDQQVALDALADGNYYVKFESLNASIDNLTGLKRILPAPEHDLYVSSATFPTTTLVPEIVAGVNATATVYSLRADETDVYAKLFFDEELVATADAQNISKNGSVNFELTGNVPATEKTYAAKIVVYYSDNSVAFETLTTNVEVAHTRTLSITEFTRNGEGEIDADASNQFSAAFNVTVQNTGSIAATPVVKIFIGETEVGTADAAVAAGESKEIAVNVTNASAGEGGNLAFTAKAYWTAEGEVKATSASDVIIKVNAAAPKFVLNIKGGAEVSDGDNVEFGLVKEATTKTYTITNSGTAPLELISIVAPTGYTATEVTAGNKTIAIDGTLDIDVTLNAEQGKKSGNLVFTYKVDAMTNNTFTLALSGRSVAADTWTEAFDDYQASIPANWTNNKWSIAGEYNDYPGAVYSYYDDATLISPRLTAEAGEELTFDVKNNYYNTATYAIFSASSNTWSDEETISGTGEITFTAPAAGDYYLRLTGRGAYIQNFVGFKLATTVPVTISQYGYTTFASMSNINADELPDGIEAFYVESEGVDDSYVRLTKAGGNIPAGTGLILKGTANEKYDLNIATGATTALKGNLMVGCLEATPLAANASSYVLINNTDEGRAEFQSLADNGITIPAGKAYLNVAGASARLMIFDDGETTGISSVLRQQARDGRVYNLNGQRVENPKKGQLYIINGKQTVVK